MESSEDQYRLNARQRREIDELARKCLLTELTELGNRASDSYSVGSPYA